MEIDWDSIPLKLKDRYKDISTIDYGLLKIAMLEDMNKQPMPVSSGVDSKSYEIFANEFNGVMLTAHIFENLLAFEDERHAREGYSDFQIKIPELYFQHPSLSQRYEISEEDSEIISGVVSEIKKKLNYSKDESFVLSQLAKLEFISIFSHLEAYVESLLVEFLNEERSNASAKIRRSALPDLMQEVFDEIDPRINTTINGFDNDALRFISFCHKLRNLHTHNLGIVNKYFYEECIKQGFLCHDIYSETSKPVLDYARLNFKYSDYIFKIGKTINLNSISQSFRLISREIVFISEVFCKEKI